MCLSPVNIPNKSFTYRPGIDRNYFQVPCGHCTECVCQKRDEMFVRMVYEFHRYTDKHGINGSCVFVTFTFNEFSLPYIDTSSIDFEPLRRFVGADSLHLPRIKVPCFDKVGFRALLKQLNNHDILPDWLQSFIPDYNRAIPIKHFVVCELGDEKHRPHVHVLFFLPWKLSNSDPHGLQNFRRVLEFCFAKRMNKKTVDKDVLHYLENSQSAQKALKDGRMVRYERGKLGDYLIYMRRNNYHKTPVYMKIPGYVKYSPKHPPVVEDINGMQYLTKYLYKHKSGDYEINHPNILWLTDFVKKLDGVDKYPDTVKPAVKLLKSSVPFSLISNEFGTSLLDEYDYDSETGKFLNEKGETEFLEAYLHRIKDLNVPNNTRKFPVPKYILRRLFYQNRHYVDYYSADLKSITYLSEFGVKATNIKLRQTYDTLVKRFKNFFGIGFFKFCDTEFIKAFEHDYKIPFLRTYQDLKMFSEPEQLSEYILFLRDVNVPLKFEYLKDSMCFDDFFEYKKLVLNIKGQQFDIDSFLDTDGKYLYGVRPDSEYLIDVMSYRFNDCKLFQYSHFEEIILFVDTVISKMRKYLYEKYKDDELRKQKLRDFYNNLIT